MLWPLHMLQKIPVGVAKNTGEAMLPRDLHVVVDHGSMGKLGKTLRSCGVDVTIMPPLADKKDLVTQSKLQKRVILCNRKFASQLQYLERQIDFYVVLSENVEEMVKEVLDHFNVKVTEDTMLSRCMVCNSDKFLQIPANDAKLLWYQKQCLLDKSKQRAEKHLEMVAQELELFDSWMKSSDSESKTQTPDLNSVTTVLSNQNSEMPGILTSFGDSNSLCKKFEKLNIDCRKVRVCDSGAEIHVENIPFGVFNQQDKFFLCSSCGKPFWVGSHYGKVQEKFKFLFKENA